MTSSTIEPRRSVRAAQVPPAPSPQQTEQSERAAPGTTASAVTAVLTCCAVIAGANLPNSLAPLYAQRFGLDALDQAVLFSSYVLALVAALLVVGAPAGAALRRAGPGRVLLIGVASALLSDVLLALGVLAPGWLLLGRLLGGVAVGLATGATATIALLGFAERGRAAVAVCAVAGALIGTVAGGALGSWTTPLPVPVEAWVYLAHLVLLTGLGAALVTAAARAGRGRSRPRSSSSAVVWVVVGHRRRHRCAGFLLGAMGWSCAGVVLGLLPVSVRASHPGASPLVAVLPCAVFLAAAWAAQVLLGPRLLRARAWQVAVVLVVGAAGVVLALRAAGLPLLLVAAAVWGAGQGPAYGLGLATATHGLAPQEQGRAASRYAAVAYGACGVSTLAVGALATASGVVTALGVLAGVLAVCGGAAAALAGPRQDVLPAAPAVPAG